MRIGDFISPTTHRMARQVNTKLHTASETDHAHPTGLLHDTVEDTNDVSFEEIGNWFGSAVRRIVEGETRFSKIGKISGMTPGADVKAEDLRQLFLAMTEEVRIIVVKLADRLHNMRTLGSMKPEKQKKIAAETLQVGFAGSLHQTLRCTGRWHAASAAYSVPLLVQTRMFQWAACRLTRCRSSANFGSCSVMWSGSVKAT